MLEGATRFAAWLEATRQQPSGVYRPVGHGADKSKTSSALKATGAQLEAARFYGGRSAFGASHHSDSVRR